MQKQSSLYNSGGVCNLAAGAHLMDNAMLIKSLNIGIDLHSLRLVMV